MNIPTQREKLLLSQIEVAIATKSKYIKDQDFGAAVKERNKIITLCKKMTRLTRIK